MKKIRGLHVENEDKLISFDVKSLFTKVPIDLSSQIIDRSLKENNTISDWTTLDLPPSQRSQNSVLGQRTSGMVTSSLSRRMGQPWALFSLQWWQKRSWKSLKMQPSRRLAPNPGSGYVM